MLYAGRLLMINELQCKLVVRPDIHYLKMSIECVKYYFYPASNKLCLLSL